MVNVIFDYAKTTRDDAKRRGDRTTESMMPNGLTLALGLVAVAAVALAYIAPRIELRRHSETHNGIRVREIALTWLRRQADRSTSRTVECAVYVTLKICNQ
jgi:hypothetical protein